MGSRTPGMDQLRFRRVDDPQTTAPAPGSTEVLVDATDTTSGFLDDKVSPGAGLTRTILNPAGNERVRLDVGANGDGSIVVNADDVQVGVLATDGQHGVRGGGNQHATATEAAAGFMAAADKQIFNQSIAGWDPTLVRCFLVDKVNGDDTRTGYLDAAAGTDLSISGPAVAIKTLARLAAIVPRFGNGRSAEIIIAAGVYSGGLFGGWTGYASLLIRGTSTDSTAGSTAFKCDATDYLHLGGVRDAATNAAGYNIAYTAKAIQAITPGTPLLVQCNAHGYATGDKVYIPDATSLPEARGYFTITVTDANHFTLDGTTSTNGNIGSTLGNAYRWKVTKAGGAAPGFTDDNTSTALQHLRLRGDAATTTAGLRNYVSTILANGVDTIVPADDLTTAVGSDVFYFEEPGVSVPVTTLLGGRRGTAPATGAPQNDLQLAGIKTGTLSVQDSSIVAAFLRATSAVTILRCGNVQIGSNYVDSAGTTRTSGGTRIEGGATLNSIDKLTLDRTGFLLAALFFNIRDSGQGNNSSPGCAWVGGLNVRGCTPDATGQQTGLILGSFPNSPTAKMCRFKGANGTLQAILVAMSGVAFFEVQISDCTNGIEIAGQGSVVDAIGVCGSRSISGFGIVFGGPVWSYGNQLLLRNINRFSAVFGTNGGLAMGTTIDPLNHNPAGPTYLDFANYFVGQVVDGNGNRVASVSSNGLNNNGAHLLSCQPWPVGEAIAAQRVVRVNGAAQAVNAQADTVAHAAGVLGLSVAAAAGSGITDHVLVAQDDAWVGIDVSGTHPAPTVGGKLWLSVDTAGLAQADEPAPDKPRVFLGYAVQTSGISKARVARYSAEVVRPALSLLMFSGAFAANADVADTAYLANAGADVATPTLRSAQGWNVPGGSRVARNLRVRFPTNPLVVACAATLYVNGVASALTVSVTTGSTAEFKDVTHTVTLAADDRLDLRLDTAAGSGGTAACIATVELA